MSIRGLLVAVMVGALAIGLSQANRVSLETEGGDLSPLMDPGSVSIASAGYSSAISSVAWVDFIFTYAGVLFDSNDPSALSGKAKLVAVADTNWAYPRLVAAWVLPQLAKTKSADVLWFLEDGARRFPNEWRFRITWAQYILENRGLDSTVARDSAAEILLPLSETSSAEVPEYARNLAFTLLHKNGKPDQAMDILVQTYRQVPDPLIRFQFQGKIADLLRRNDVRLGAADSADFLHAIAGMLDSNDPAQIEPARQILVALVRPETQSKALVDARALARDFRAYRQASASGR